MNKKVSFAMIFVFLIASGCSTHYSTLSVSKQDESSVLYNIKPEKALEVAQWSLLHTIPGHSIDEIKGPIRGYCSYTRFALDTYSQQVLAIPARAKSLSGDEVYGFYFEVSGQGSSGSGMAYNNRIFKNLMESLKKLNAEVPVTDVSIMSWDDFIKATK